MYYGVVSTNALQTCRLRFDKSIANYYEQIAQFLGQLRIYSQHFVLGHSWRISSSHLQIGGACFEALPIAFSLAESNNHES